MKNKMVRALVLGLTMSTIMMTGSVATFAEEAEVTEETAETEGAEEEGETADADKEAADNAAALIDKMYRKEQRQQMRTVKQQKKPGTLLQMSRKLL